MTMKLSTTLIHLNSIPNPINASLVKQFYEYLKEIGTSENYQNQNLKQLINFAIYLGEEKTLYEVSTKDEIVSFLNTKIKDSDLDPDKKCITTWNDYLWRVKYFFRWLHNYRLVKKKGEEPLEISDWTTPEFASIKKKKSKRISPYLESELWEKEDLLTIIKYEPSKRNKAILALLWDLDARPHEVALLKIKHIRLKEKYGEGEIPHEAKTGTGPILLTTSFPYVRDWLNEHPFKNESQARLICNLNNGCPITPDAIDKVMKQLHRRIIRLLENEQINNNDEKVKLQFLLETKKWNPYCVRHSAITADSDYLPEYALKKKVRWSMNSKQGSRYIKRRMGNDLKQKNIQLQRLNADLEKLKNETSRTQSELKGEAGEINLCSLLENEFKDDIFERQKRGSSSGDIVQRIKTTAGIIETPIVFDNKESQNITRSDLEKAKKYKTIHKTNYVIIVSRNLPKKECGDGVIGEKEGILLLHPSIVLELTRQIRKFLVDLSREKISQQDRLDKEAQMFTFITSQEITRKLNSLYEVYSKMNDLHVKEQRDHQNLWKTKNTLIEDLRQIYVEITGGIDSIVQGNSEHQV